MPGYQELIIIFLIVLLIFGGRKIPEIARGLGRGIREFKKAKDDLMNEADTDENAVTEEGQEKSDQPGRSTDSAAEHKDSNGKASSV